MMPVELPHCFHRRALLLSQALSHLCPERRPIVGADVRFETRCQQRANRCKHCLAAVHTYCALRRGPSSRLWRRHQRRWGRWCLHLHGHGRLGLSGRRQRHQRAQSKQLYLSLKFFHAFCRSPHSGQSLFLSPPVAVLRPEGHIRERSMSPHNSKASCQSTSPKRTPSRNPGASLRTLSCLSVSALSLLLRCESNTRPGQHLRLPRASIIVEMLRGSARDGPLP